VRLFVASGAVEWPGLGRSMRMAVNLPLTRIYDIAWRLWGIYCRNMQVRNTGWRGLFRKGMQYIADLFEKEKFHGELTR